jgi:hypothetical protein
VDFYFSFHEYNERRYYFLGNSSVEAESDEKIENSVGSIEEDEVDEESENTVGSIQEDEVDEESENSVDSIKEDECKKRKKKKN